MTGIAGNQDPSSRAMAAEPVVTGAPPSGPGAANGRLAYVDHLRIAAALAVVMIHVSAMHWSDTAPASADWQAMNVYAAISRWSVPVFFMISGSLFLAHGRQNSPRRIWQHYIPRLLVMYVAWSAAYTVMSAVFQRIYDPVFLLQHLWDGYYHLWYLLALAGVYMLIPLLQRIAAVPELASYFVVLTGAASLLLPTVVLIPVVGELSTDLVERVAPFLVAGYPFYFVLGHLLHEHGATLPKWSRRTAYGAGAAGAGLTVAATAWLSIGRGQPSGEFYGYLTIGVALAAVAVFIFFRVRGGDVVTSPRLAMMARWTLPIYLIHPAFVRVLQEFNITPGLLPGVIGIPVVWLLVLLLSTLASAVLVKIPLVNSWLV